MTSLCINEAVSYILKEEENSLPGFSLVNVCVGEKVNHFKSSLGGLGKSFCFHFCMGLSNSPLSEPELTKLLLSVLSDVSFFL